MKFVKFWEIPNYTNMDTTIAKWQQLLEGMQTTSVKYPIYVFELHGIG